MNPNVIDCCEYTRIGSKLLNKGNTLLIRQRKKTTPQKPKNFLLKLIPNSSKGSYISSLYPTGKEGVFSFDFNNELYQLELTNDWAKIQKRHI